MATTTATTTPCDCCGAVSPCCPGRTLPPRLYVTFADTGGCGCLDGLAFDFDPLSPDPVVFTLSGGCAGHNCTGYPRLEFGCGGTSAADFEAHFPIAVTDVLCGCAIDAGVPVVASCDPFYLEYHATLPAHPVIAPSLDNCCAGTVTITFSETPP